MDTVGLLLRAELRSAWNWLRFSRRRGAVIVATVAVGLLVVPLAAGLAFGGGFVMARLDVDPRALFEVGFLAVTVATFIFGLPGVITAFFADRKLLLLAAAPVPIGAVLVVRMVQASLPAIGGGLLVFVGTAGYGVGRGADPLYYLLAALLVVVLALSTVAFALIAMTFVLRVVPANRARDVAALLAAGLAASLYLVQLLASPARSLRRQSGVQTLAQFRAQVATLGDHLVWVPTSWPAATLAAWLTHGAQGSLPWAALTLAFLAVTWGAAWLLYRRTFVIGLGVFGESGAAARKPRATAPRSAGRAAASAPHPVRALVAKDLVTLRRDIRRLAGVLPAMVMAIVYSIVNSRNAGATVWSVILPLGFVPILVGAALALPAVSTEGRGIQLLALAGTPMRILLEAKLVFAGALVTGMTVAAALLLNALHGGSAADTAISLAVALWLGLGCAAIGVSIGALGPSFETPAGRPRASTAATFGGLLLMALFAGVTYGGLAMATRVAASGRWAAVLLPVIALAGLVAASLVAGSLVAALAALERLRPGDA